MGSRDRIKHVFNDLIKSEEDKRLYRGLELTNGLKVILVSDPTTDKSAAALDVHIGSMSDPWELPGLAHFLEHMLFMGTEKYPCENDYDKFLSEHGGGCNAFTSLEHTKYYFDIGPDHLHGALDRFAQFFITPLFAESSTEREVNAVNSENDKNICIDSRRLSQMEKATMDQTHDYAKFSTGNKESLLTNPRKEGIDTREELLKFHKQFYSSNIMSLAVLGKESLEELETMVLDLFDGIENKDVEIPEWQKHPFGSECQKMQYQLVPVKDIRKLRITWPIPDLRPHNRTKPGRYLGHLIGHEGKGSLFSELKNKGWVNSLSAGERRGARGFMFFDVDMNLTEEGLSKSRVSNPDAEKLFIYKKKIGLGTAWNHTNEIITTVYQYIGMLYQEKPQQWVFEECKGINALNFRFKDKEQPSSYVCNLTTAVHNYCINEVLCGSYFTYEFKPELIEMLLAHLKPEQMRVTVVSKDFSGKTDLVEKWYGSEYSKSPIADVTIKNWKNVPPNANLHLPPKNEFIAENFDLTKREESANTVPSIAFSNDMVRVWFKQDDKFLLPKSCISIDITSPYVYTDTLAANLNHMFVALLNDSLTEYTYDAELAGLGYNLSKSEYGLCVDVWGYNDKQNVLLERIIERIATLQIKKDRFDILKEKYIRDLKNFTADQPYQHAMYYMTSLISEQMWTKEQLLTTAPDTTLEKLEQFIPQLLSKLFLEMLVFGNVTKQHARDVADTVLKTLSNHAKTKPLPLSEQRRFRQIQLPDGCSYVYKRKNEVHKNSSLEVYYQCNLQETSTNMVVELFTQIVKEPCFNILRTKEQLGYITSTSVRRKSGVQGIKVVVQSDKSPQYVETRIEAFLLEMEKLIDEMDEETFGKNKEALATKRLEKPKKLRSQHNKYLGEISSQTYNFDRDNIEVALLKTLTKEDVQAFYKEFIAHNAPRRHKITVHIESSQNVDPAQEEVQQTSDDMTDVPPLKQAQTIEDVDLFKRQHGLFPLPKPFINIAIPAN